MNVDYVKNFLEGLDTERVYVEKEYEFGEPEDILVIELKEPLKMGILANNSFSSHVVDVIYMASQQKTMCFAFNGYEKRVIKTVSLQKVDWAPCSERDLMFV